MNKKTIVTYIGVGCLLAVLTVWSYCSTQGRMLEVAERTFVEAVHQDLDGRWKKFGKTVNVNYGKEKKNIPSLLLRKKVLKNLFL